MTRGRGSPGGEGAKIRIAGMVALLALVAAQGAQAQSLSQRVQRVQDGKVRLSYATRPGVCGNGRNISVARPTDDWESDCQHGPARVVLDWRDGKLVKVDTYVGGRWREPGAEVTDLGTVGAADAAAYLLDLAARVPGSVGDDLIFPATIADSATVWPQLARLGRDASVPRETRKSAVFWLGQAAGAEVTRTLGHLVEDTTDREIQKAAVFALSQHKGDDAVPMLIRIAREHKDPEVRKAAMFWLGQTGDERAVAFFEEILTGR
jgi:hypothetical protein